MAVGIVIVSHSARLAEGVVELAGQMAQGDIALLAAGGTDDGSLGTSIDKVTAALQQATGPDGTLVLVDLGSAVMITEMALEMLDEPVRQRIRISSAPLVEGAVLAAVEAASGSNLDEVAQAADEGSAMPKTHKT
ncbi:MAG TPA: dihydroxyacetone kinase phosphoryl donor subunit DhaM [Dictyobacter sp.]|jgi:dihydroxyacetone kinase phosphotransfer subunit|nr:dihydroxyacetone kinase phosphoryl donor subunit DhaM [Dictyobacter sp.]